ncbi:hypothetical protein EUX98_g7892 [Antrodiella citrinella]|uniref:Arrestin-like N-terminal domain-containing protein n=1 Tax=Antrodiella citrinella TaxID=2447956 RepID=A0A4S4MKP8_9APHY|nr:hypothetical protein EUX98_g7892 [Antrodiella citrinella]
MSFRLQFPTSICVGGDILRGEVELQFPEAQKEKIQEVIVRLKGSVVVKIKRSSGSAGSSTRRETLDIVRQDVKLWKKEHGTASKETKTLKLPFHFQLPPNAPPSCQLSGRKARRSQRHEAFVVYFIEVVGVRTGFFKKNRYIRRPLAVLPADERGAPISKDIERLGAAYPSRKREFKKKMRRGLFGRSATVRMELTLPDIETIPLFIRIPYVLRIITLTKRMRFEEKTEDPDVKLFPRHPTQPAQIQWVLRRHASLQAKDAKMTATDVVAHLGGLGKGDAKQHVDVQVLPREWVPAERYDGQGSWMQITTLKSFIMLRSAPTFSTRLISVSYSTDMTIKFPGWGNNMIVASPIHVTSGLSTSTQSDAASFTHYGEHDLDLPPHEDLIQLPTLQPHDGLLRAVDIQHVAPQGTATFAVTRQYHAPVPYHSPQQLQRAQHIESTAAAVPPEPSGNGLPYDAGGRSAESRS